MAVRDFSAHGTTRVAKVAEGVEVCVLLVRGRKTVDRIRSADLRTLRGKDCFSSASSSDLWVSPTATHANLRHFTRTYERRRTELGVWER